jgi:hypothetical protein
MTDSTHRCAGPATWGSVTSGQDDRQARQTRGQQLVSTRVVEFSGGSQVCGVLVERLRDEELTLV